MIYWIFLVFIKLASANLSISSKLIEEAVFVTSKYYNPELITSVLWTYNDAEDVNEFLIKYTGTVVTIEYNDNTTLDAKHIEYKQAIFFTDGPDQFEKYSNLLTWIIRYPTPLVLVLKNPIEEISELSTYTEIAWKNNLVDIVILSRNKVDKISTHTYFPYRNGKCGNCLPVNIKHGENIFPNKFKNFNKCPIRISARQHPPFIDMIVENGIITNLSGYDAIALQLMIERLNATANIVRIPHYGHYSNGTASGGFSDLIDNKTDMLVPAGILSEGRYSVTQASHPYYNADIRWIGPQRREINHWIKLLIPFLNRVTPLLCLSFILFVMTAILVRRRKSIKSNRRNSLCFRAFSLLVGQAVSYVTNVPLLNNLFLIWIWFCFIVRIEYQGYLVNSLQKHILESPFTFEEAVVQMDGYGGFENYFDFFVNTSLEQGYTIISRTNFSLYLNRIVEGERFLLVADTLLLQRAHPFIQVLDEPISTSTSCFYMRAGWPPAKAIDSMVVNLVEAGFLDYIVGKDDRLDDDNDDIDADAQALSMSILSACFYGICFMWVVCSIILLLEIICYKYKNTIWTRRLNGNGKIRWCRKIINWRQKDKNEVLKRSPSHAPSIISKPSRIRSTRNTSVDHSE